MFSNIHIQKGDNIDVATKERPFLGFNPSWDNNCQEHDIDLNKNISKEEEDTNFKLFSSNLKFYSTFNNESKQKRKETQNVFQVKFDRAFTTTSAKGNCLYIIPMKRS